MMNPVSEKTTLKWMCKELKIDHLIPSEICNLLEQELYPNNAARLHAHLKKTTCCSTTDIEPEACYTPSLRNASSPEFTGYLLASGEPLSLSGEVTLTDFSIMYSRDGELLAYCRKFEKNGCEYYPCDETAMHLEPLWVDPANLFIERSTLQSNLKKQKVTGSEKALALLTLYYAKHSKKFRYGDHVSSHKMGEHINELFDLYKSEVGFSDSGLLKINNVISDAMKHLEIKDQQVSRLTDKHPYTNPAPLKEKN